MINSNPLFVLPFRSGHKIYVTGSNAHLISREIATFLKGRSLETTIYPFSFPEFLQLKKIGFQPKDIIINQSKIVNLFEEYLQYGGFPEVIKVNVEDKRTIAKVSETRITSVS